jgi:hypothetical protein
LRSEILPVQIVVDRLQPAILGKDLAQQIAFARRHLVDHPARPVAQLLRILAVAGGTRHEQVDVALHPHEAFLTRCAGLFEDDALPLRLRERRSDQKQQAGSSDEKARRRCHWQTPIEVTGHR